MYDCVICKQFFAANNRDVAAPFVSVEAIVNRHWSEFGRNYYTRCVCVCERMHLSCCTSGNFTLLSLLCLLCSYDYEGVESDRADAVMAHLLAQITAFNAAKAADAAHSKRRHTLSLCSFV